MMTTTDLINTLAMNVPPVRPLRAPITRAVFWLLLASIILVLLAISQGTSPDLANQLQDPVFIARVSGTMLTGILATFAAFMLSLPDRSRFWLLLPMPALALWLTTLGYECVTDWVSVEPSGVRFDAAARCFATLVLASLPLSLALLLMLRHAAALRPTAVILTSSLAIAAIATTGLSVCDDVDPRIMIPIWDIGTALLLISLGGVFGRKMFSWVAPLSGIDQT